MQMRISLNLISLLAFLNEMIVFIASSQYSPPSTQTPKTTLFKPILLKIITKTIKLSLKNIPFLK